jgi:plasmid stabilization system protein ParE
MRFAVQTLRAAERDCNKILEYIAARSKTGAAAWAKAFDKALAYLEDNADACPLAAENEHVEFEVRETLFKTRRGLIYRALFTLREDTAIILHIRGPGQDFVASMEIRDPD